MFKRQNLYLWYLSPRTCCSLLSTTIIWMQCKRNQQQMVFRIPLKINCPMDKFFSLTHCLLLYYRTRNLNHRQIVHLDEVGSHISFGAVWCCSGSPHMACLLHQWDWLSTGFKWRHTQHQREMWLEDYLSKTQNIYLWYLSPKTCWSLLFTTILNAM